MNKCPEQEAWDGLNCPVRQFLEEQHRAQRELLEQRFAMNERALELQATIYDGRLRAVEAQATEIKELRERLTVITTRALTVVSVLGTVFVLLEIGIRMLGVVNQPCQHASSGANPSEV